MKNTNSKNQQIQTKMEKNLGSEKRPDEICYNQSVYKLLCDSEYV